MDPDYSIARVISLSKHAQEHKSIDPVERELWILRTLKTEYDRVQEMVPGNLAPVIAALKERIDIRNIKILVRAFLYPDEVDMSWLTPTEFFSQDRIAKLKAVESIEEAMPIFKKTQLRKAIRDAYQRFERAKNLSIFDASLNGYLAGQTWQAALASREPGLIDVVGTKYDIYNLQIVLRGKIIENAVQFAKLRNWLLPVYWKLDERDLTKTLHAEDYSAFLQVVRQGPYAIAIKKVSRVEPEAIEEALDRHWSLLNKRYWATKQDASIPYIYLNILEMQLRGIA